MQVFVDYFCKECNEVLTERRNNKEDMSKSVCKKCGSEVDRHYASAPPVHYNGQWFSNRGSY